MDDIALIPLANSNRVACINQEDLDKILGHTWWEWVGPHGGNYAYTSINKKTVKMHRVILEGVAEIDHINRNGLDNRRSNLRSATRIQNCLNRVKRKSELNLTGVSYDVRRGVYSARLYVDGLTVSLGVFATALEAGLARDRAMTEWAGEYAIYNF